MSLLCDELVKTSFLVLRKSEADMSCRCDFGACGSPHAHRLPESTVSSNETIVSSSRFNSSTKFKEKGKPRFHRRNVEILALASEHLRV